MCRITAAANKISERMCIYIFLYILFHSNTTQKQILGYRSATSFGNIVYTNIRERERWLESWYIDEMDYVSTTIINNYALKVPFQQQTKCQESFIVFWIFYIINNIIFSWTILSSLAWTNYLYGKLNHTQLLYLETSGVLH